MEPDDWLNRWQRKMPFGPWPLSEMDEMIREIERSFAAHFKNLDIDVTVNEQKVIISVDTENRKYYKELDLPGLVKPEGAKSTYNNGILEITLPLKSAKGSGVRVKVE